MKKRRGQVLVLVLLVVVVALAVGLSVASRNLTNLRTSTQTEQSQRAFNAAEGGIESVLPDLAAAAVAGSQQIQVGNLEANVTVNEEPEYFWTIPEGEVGQVDLSGASNITVEWIKKGDLTEDVSPKASIELTFVCESNLCFGNSGSDGYSQYRRAYEAEANTNQQGFTTCTFGIDFVCSQTFTVLASDNAKLLRIRPFWNQATVKVTGTNLLVQQYEVISSATSELGLTRKIQVTKTALPQLPAVFDYVLYSEQGIVK